MKRIIFISGTVLVVAVAILSVLFYYANSVYDFKPSVSDSALPEVDVIVCLGGGKYRIQETAQVWLKYKKLTQETSVPLPILYLAGMGPKLTWTQLEKHFQEDVNAVIRPEDVVLETESVNTEENAEYFLRKLRERGWNKVLLVTSSYHLKRAHDIFRRVFEVSGIPIELSTMSVSKDPFESREWWYSPIGVEVTVVEYFKWIYYQKVWEPQKVL